MKSNGVSKRNKVFFSFTVILLIIILAFVLIYFYVNSKNFRDNARSIIIKQLENVLEKKVEIGSIDTISWQSIQLTHIAILENNQVDNEVLFYAENAEARFFLSLPSLQKLRELQLYIKEIIFFRADLDITRDVNGDFDLVKKLSLDPEAFEGKIAIEQVSFRDSFLSYHDESIYHYNQEQLTTLVRDINGFFNLTSLPEIKFDLKGVQNPDKSLLSISGSLFVNKIDYSLDFYLQNADITHFQYYIEGAEQFNINQGRFDLKLNLSFSEEWQTDEIFWQGEAIIHKTDARPIFLKQIPLKEIDGSVSFVKPELKIKRLTGLYHDQAFTLEGQALTKPEIYYDLNLEGKQIDVSLLKEDILLFVIDEDIDIAIEGKIDLSGNINGLSDYYYFNGSMASSEIKIGDNLLPNISGDFSINNNELIISNLGSTESDSKISINGGLSWSDDIPSYQFAVETSNLSFKHSLLQQFSFLESISGSIYSKLKIESEKDDCSKFDLIGSFTISDMGRDNIYLPYPLKGNLSATVSLSDNLLSLNRCELQSGGNNGFLEGSFKFEELISFILDFELQASELEEYGILFGPDLKMTGNVGLTGKLKGDSEQSEIEAEIQLSEFSLNSNQIEELTGSIFYKNDLLSIESFILSTNGMELTGEGSISTSLVDKPEVAISCHLSPLNIEQFQERLNFYLPLSGQIKGDANISGLWPDLIIDSDLRLEEVIYQDYYFGNGEILFLLEPEQNYFSEKLDEDGDYNKTFSGISQDYSVSLKHLELKNDDMELIASGLMKTENGFPFSLKIALSHQEFNGMVEHFFPEEDNLYRFLPRHITGEATFAGNTDKQEVSLSFQLIPQQQENNPPSKLEAILSIDKGDFNISDFQLVQSEGLFEAKGVISTDKTLKIEFSTTQLDISTLTSLMQLEEEIKGIMNIKGMVSGTIEQPEIAVSAQIREGYFREFKFENLSSELVWNSLINLISIKELTIVLEEEYQITAKGNIPVKSFLYTFEEDLDSMPVYSDIPLNFEINMNRADLNLLKIFWKDTFSDITGVADLEIFLTGTAGKPVVNGTIGIYEGIINFTELPVQVEEINETIRIINNKVTIPPISFIAFENRFNIFGGFELAHLLPDNIYFNIKNEDKKIVYQNILESEFDLDLIIEKSILHPHISGQILLYNGVLNVNDLLQMEKNIALNGSPYIYKNNSADQLDINITLQDPFKLKMNNADIEIGGKITLNGLLTEPGPEGTLVLKKGYFLYFDKKFSISDGLVTINGLDSRDIELNARASTNVQGVQVNISVLGNLSNPQIFLSSQPSLKETEILSLLTFDRNIQGLSEGEISQLLSEEMVNIIFQSLQLNLFKRVEREIAEGLGLEFLRISFNNQENGGTHFFLEDLHLSDLTLEVGKNIGDDLLITYSTPLDFQGETSIGLDYKLSPEFTFSTQLDAYSFKKEDYKIKFGLEIRF